MQKAFKEQVVPNRVGTRNAQEVTDHRRRGAAPARRDDAPAPAKVGDFGGDQEKLCQAEGFHRHQLVLEPRFGNHKSVTAVLLG